MASQSYSPGANHQKVTILSFLDILIDCLDIRTWNG